jgi:hypothetical protein
MVQMIIRRPWALVICKNLVLALLATAPDEGLIMQEIIFLLHHR